MKKADLCAPSSWVRGPPGVRRGPATGGVRTPRAPFHSLAHWARATPSVSRCRPPVWVRPILAACKRCIPYAECTCMRKMNTLDGNGRCLRVRVWHANAYGETDDMGKRPLRAHLQGPQTPSQHQKERNWIFCSSKMEMLEKLQIELG
ncbi:hypothetical protein CDAR_548981 [Caerostris darwini]|uniref:Uncharacterized protein n=1 Tax=Caerostris darwini TaxID=1538125 RepID=A0AAV4WIQ4_9ARAC|nr:hypothetical protein CDAR_548981 [Caerostris darwini]